jgi:diguanylate cyclase (GGDEF)-like protein
MMVDVLNAALFFWSAAVWLAALQYDDQRYQAAAVAGVLASLLVNLSPGGWWPGTVFHALTFAAAASVPAIHRRALRWIARNVTKRSGSLLLQRDRGRRRLESLGRERDARWVEVDEIQNRFTLVQVMATKLEAGEILQTLGQMWKARPSVKGCLILRRQPNGNWGTAYTDGHFNALEWVRTLTAQPALARARRIRRTTPAHSQLSLPGQPFGSSVLLVPFHWDRDVLALGVIEVTPEDMESQFEALNLERKLVSIGLRRADLYDLMTERSRHDALTGAFLRRSLMERLDDALRKSQRYNTPVFFALMDIDHFKSLNDRFGHLMGDKVLAHLADSIRKLSRPGISLGRFGGDEFALVLEMDRVEEATEWFDRLRRHLADTPVREGSAEVRATLSAGVAAYLPDHPPLSELMAQADEALYQAKKAGRDRVVIWRAPGPGASLGRS